MPRIRLELQINLVKFHVLSNPYRILCVPNVKLLTVADERQNVFLTAAALLAHV